MNILSGVVLRTPLAIGALNSIVLKYRNQTIMDGIWII